MNYRRALNCFTIACLLTLALPDRTSAAAGSGDSTAETECEHDDQRTTTPNEREDRVASAQPTDENEHEGTDTTDAPCAPPVSVAEAPTAWLLSASAALTGAAAVLILRRRARGALPAAT